MSILSDPYSVRSQMIIMLLAAHHDLKGSRSKGATIAMIESRKWFSPIPEDLLPYPSSSNQESRWITLLAFARKDCVENDLFADDEIRDDWQITKKGINCFSKIKSDFISGELDCSKCFLWTSAFKEYMNPSYESNELDKPRPETIYDDIAKEKKMQIYLNIGR